MLAPIIVMYIKQWDMTDPEVVFNLGVIDGPVAAIPSLFAVIFYARYGIDRKRYAEIREQLDARGKSGDA